jgi:hypothetical protein
MFANKPKMAKKWAKETPEMKVLPMKLKPVKAKAPKTEFSKPMKVGMKNRMKWTDSVK